MNLKSKHKFIALIAFSLTVALLGYLFVFPYHYQVSFSTKQPTGVVFDHLRAWPEFSQQDSVWINNKSLSFYDRLTQDIKTSLGNMQVDWKIKRNSDRTTHIQGRFTATQHPIIQKLLMPIGLSFIPERSINLTESLAKGLIEKSKNFIVHSIRDTVLPAIYCAYIPVKTRETNKAQGMLRQISTVMDYLKGNAIALKGDPMIQVTRWSKQQQQLEFDFCFPIDAQENLPEHPEVAFKYTNSGRYLKATFNGNYRISQQGWYALMDHAQRNGIRLGDQAIEIYRNDPHEGGDSMEWVAEILMPILE